MASRARQATMIMKTSDTLLVERVERLNKLFQKRWEGLQRNLSLTIFLCNPSVLREGTLLGEICLLFMTDLLEHRVTR